MLDNRLRWGGVGVVGLLLLIAGGGGRAWGLDVPLTVKEVAGVGATGYPISVVVPLPAGTYQGVGQLRVVGPDGAAVPAQVEVLNRWWGKDNAIRHVVVHFQPTVGAFSGAGTGQAVYRLRDDGAGPGPVQPVTVSETGTTITVGTGAVTLTIQKAPFQVMTAAGGIEATVTGRTAVQKSFERTDVTVTVEERGPMRAVIRAEAPTLYTDAANHTHGWAMRVYAYAGKPYVKVDYQLQNSAKTKVYAAPLYFKALSLSRPGGVAATMRYMAEMQGAVTASTVELIPASGAWVNGLYWLDDMRHVVFETMYWLGGTPQPETFQYPPVATVPTSWYGQTRATLDLGGIVPTVAAGGKTDRRRPGAVDAAHTGWDNFYIDVERKLVPSVAGGLAYSASAWIATEDPADVYEAERFALGELNVRPQWLAQYQHDQDWPVLRLSANPYAGVSWRKYEPEAPPGSLAEQKLDAPYLAGTGRRSLPRDDQHAWFYHVEEAYYATGNLWIKDWHQFLGEYRKTFLNRRDPYPDPSSRGIGHALASVMAAYRITGNPTLLPTASTPAVVALKASILPTGSRDGSCCPPPPLESVFMTGYLSRALISYLEEVGSDSAGLRPLVQGFVSWNVQHANFGYNVDPSDPNLKGVSSGTAVTMGDPQAWWVWKTGDPAALAHLNAYIATGINGGSPPYGDLTRWRVGTVEEAYVGRITQYVRDGSPPPPPPPPALTATFTSPPAGATVSGTVTVGMAAGGSSGAPTFKLAVDSAVVSVQSGVGTTASYLLDTTQLTNGAHTLTLTVTDGAQTATATRTVTVSNTGGAITIGETAVLATDDSGNGNLLVAQQASLGQTATIQSLSLYVTTAAGKLRLGIYDASGANGGPGTKKAETAEITPVAGWNTANVTAPVSLPAGTYWLAYLPSSSSLGFRKVTGSAPSRYYSVAYGAMPTTFSASSSTTSSHWSFYATLVGTAGPTVSLSAAPTSVSVGGSSVLTWSSTNTTSCTASGGWSGAQGTSGSWSVSPATTTTYTLTCTGAGGSATGSATVTVTSPSTLTLTLTVTPTSIAVGGSATLSWSSTNATACSASGGWAGTQGTSGSWSVSPATTTTYTLTCTGAGGSVSRSTTLTVTGSGGAITIGETAVLATDDSGNGNLLVAQQASLGQTATIQSLSLYVTTAAGKLRLGIYDASGANGGPGTKKAETAEITPVAGWNTANVTAPVSLPAGTYWLAYLPSSSSLGFRKVTGSAPSRYYSVAYGAMPTTFSASSSTTSSHWSFYATLVGTAGPTVSLSAAPTSVSVGGSSVLTWSSTNTTSCTASGGWSGAKATSGSQTLTNLTATATYTLTCTGPGGSATGSVTVTVMSLSTLTLTLTVTPTSIAVGGSATLSWNSTNATACSASGGWAGTQGTSGSWSVSPASTTSYTLTCTNASEQVSQTATLAVGGQNPILAAIPDNTALDLGAYTCNQPTDSPWYCESITDYSGLVYDPFGHRMLMFGGGHSATQRTDIDGFNLNPAAANALMWAPLYPSTPASAMTAANVGAQGQWLSTGHPLARHTYHMVHVMSVGGAPHFVIATEGAAGDTPAPVKPTDTRIARYDLASGVWRYGPRPAWYFAGMSAVDPISKKILVVSLDTQAGSPSIWLYDPVTEQVVRGPGVPSGIGYANNLVYFPPNDKFYVIARGSPTQVVEVTLNRTNLSASTAVVVTGMSGAPATEEKGWAYDAKNQLIGGGVTNGTFYAYNPLTKQWTARTMVAQSVSGAAIGSVAFHALDYDPVNNVYLFITDSLSGRRTWAYRY